MAKNTNPRKPIAETHRPTKSSQNKEKQKQQQQLPSWAVMKNILTCKHLEVSSQQPHNKKNKQKPTQTGKITTEETMDNKKSKKMRCSGSSLCNNTKVMHRPETSSPETLQRKIRTTPSSSSSSSSHEGLSNRSYKTALALSDISNNNTITNSNSSSSSTAAAGGLHKSSSSSNSGASSAVKGMPFRRFSGCYECRMIVDPVLAYTRDPSLRATTCSFPDCGQVFMKPENLELHQAVRHAVSELGSDDTSKNIVEIIFQSSWLMKEIPVCKIDRILKVHNTQRTVNRFEEYRDLIKLKATNMAKKHPRCIADGNELLRFYCTTFKCSLGLNGSSNLCNSIPHCNICSIVKNGFKLTADKGILTTATSGRAHEQAGLVVGPDDDEHEKRAMLVCRVIAGRVKKTVEPSPPPSGDCDSVAGPTGVYSNLDELYVFNPKAILPCFVVIYTGF